MKLGLDQIKKLNTKEIAESLTVEIDKIYSSISYIGMNKKAFYELVQKEITKSKKDYSGNIDYIEYIKNKIQQELIKQIIKMLSNSDTAIKIINNYSNLYLNHATTHSTAIKNIMRLDKLFEIYSYIPDPDTLMKLLDSNKTISSSVTIIFNKYKNDIISGHLEEVFDNNTIIQLIEAYCIMNNIEIKEAPESEKDETTEENSYETSNDLRLYLQEIGKIPLLTPEEEKYLAQRIVEGDMTARKKFIEGNLRLVVSVAKRYIGSSLAILDLIQEGNTGLILAVDRFDVKRNTKFSTYAISWIRQSITRSIADKGRNIRIPSHLYYKMLSYRKIESELACELHRKPTIEEIAKRMGISLSQAKTIAESQDDTLSINYTTEESEDNNIEEVIPSPDDEPETISFNNSMQREIKRLIEVTPLTDKEKKVIKLRFGLDGERTLTLEEVGKIIGVTRERTRQIEEKALYKLREPKKVKSLAEYTGNPAEALERVITLRRNYHDKPGKSTKTSATIESPLPEVLNVEDYFKYNTKEQLDIVISQLPQIEQSLITIMFLGDLSKVTDQDKNTIYRVIIPKMQRMLAEEDKRMLIKTPLDIYQNLVIELLTRTVNEIMNYEYQCQKDVTKDDYNKVLLLLKKPEFAHLVEVLSPEQAVTIILKLGCLDKRYFSGKSIAKFLKVDELQVEYNIKESRELLKAYFENQSKGYQRKFIK